MHARFMLALEDDTTGFHERFDRDPLLGATARSLIGYRPLRLATVAHAALRAMCGQLIESRRAAAIERSILRELGARGRHARGPVPPLRRRPPPARSRHCPCDDSAPTRRARSTSSACERTRRVSCSRRLLRERGIGPWSVGVIALEGLGRYDHGLVGDLGLVKLLASHERAPGRGRRDGGAPRAVRGVAGTGRPASDAGLVARASSPGPTPTPAGGRACARSERPDGTPGTAAPAASRLCVDGGRTSDESQYWARARSAKR